MNRKKTYFKRIEIHWYSSEKLGRAQLYQLNECLTTISYCTVHEYNLYIMSRKIKFYRRLSEEILQNFTKINFNEKCDIFIQTFVLKIL